VNFFGQKKEINQQESNALLVGACIATPDQPPSQLCQGGRGVTNRISQAEVLWRVGLQCMLIIYLVTCPVEC